MTTLKHPPHSSDLATGDFYLFLVLKSALKEWGCRDAADIIKNATEELKKAFKK